MNHHFFLKTLTPRVVIEIPVTLLIIWYSSLYFFILARRLKSIFSCSFIFHPLLLAQATNLIGQPPTLSIDLSRISAGKPYFFFFSLRAWLPSTAQRQIDGQGDYGIKWRLGWPAYWGNAMSVLLSGNWACVSF